MDLYVGGVGIQRFAASVRRLHDLVLLKPASRRNVKKIVTFFFLFLSRAINLLFVYARWIVGPRSFKSASPSRRYMQKD
jgi:hypothetical protein